MITGAGSGMGREMALIAARDGALLAISDWNEHGLAETVDLLKAAGARELRSDVVDVSDRAAVGEWATAVVEQFGRVNVAGEQRRRLDDRRLRGHDLRGVRLDRRASTSTGVVNGTKEFLPHLIASGDGILVNISSLFGLISMPGQTAYNATKYAVRGFTEALREEMLINGHPVTVTCVHPGGIKTGIARNGRKTAGQDAAADRPALRPEAREDDRRARPRGSSSTARWPARRACSSVSTRTPCTTSPSSPARATRTSSRGSPRSVMPHRALSGHSPRVGVAAADDRRRPARPRAGT